MNQRIKAEDEIHRIVRNHRQRLSIVDMVGAMVDRKPLLASFDAALRQIDYGQLLTQIVQVLRAPADTRCDLQDSAPPQDFGGSPLGRPFIALASRSRSTMSCFQRLY